MWKWRPIEETGYGYGIWASDDELCIPISDWMNPQKLPTQCRFGNNIIKVRNEDNHGICPECYEAL